MASTFRLQPNNFGKKSRNEAAVNINNFLQISCEIIIIIIIISNFFSHWNNMDEEHAVKTPMGIVHCGRKVLFWNIFSGTVSRKF